MDNDLIERLAREAGLMAPQTAQFAIPSMHPDGLQRLIALVAEECAKVCEDEDEEDGFGIEGRWCAAAIRAKFPRPT